MQEKLTNIFNRALLKQKAEGMSPSALIIYT